MKKEYGAALRKLFAEQMRVCFPEFVETKVSSRYFNPGDRAYVSAFPTGTWLWIVLSPHWKGVEEFTVHIGWSRKARYPESSAIPSAVMPNAGGNEREHEEYMTRLPYLWESRPDYWVIDSFVAGATPEEALAQLMRSMEPVSKERAEAMVRPLVEDAIRALGERGIPYLESAVSTGAGAG
jgi:hypothetical protein